MSERKPIRIGADGVDVEAIVREITERVDERRRRGEYDDAAIARAERYNLVNLRDDDAFMDRYMACLRHVTTVDINDFAIVERRKRFARPLIAFKTALWKLLRFYTFRLWSQQNQVNGVLLSAIEINEARGRRRIEALERRLAALEKAVSEASPCSRDATEHGSP